MQMGGTVGYRNLLRIGLEPAVVVLNSNIGTPKTRNLRRTYAMSWQSANRIFFYIKIASGVKRTGVFRIALPNGTYEIRCYFHAGVVAPVDINLIANGEKKFQKLRLTSAEESAERRYTVTITDERLTQVIYTRKKRWVWNGFTVKRLSKGE